MISKSKTFNFLSRKTARFAKTELFAAFSTTTITTAVKMLTGLVVNKVIAITIGPSGIAFVGQFVNFKTLTTNLASGSFKNGLTKYVSDPNYSTKHVVATSNIFSVALSIIVGLGIIIFSPSLSVLILKDKSYSSVFVVFGLLLPFCSLNTLLLGVVNGFRNFRVLAYLKITNNVIGLVLSTLLVLNFQLTGALFAHALNTSIVFIISIILLYYFFSVSQFLTFNLSFFKTQILWKLLGFTLMALSSSQLQPIVELFIRDYIIRHASESEAGLWQSMVYLSRHYLSVITAAIGVYYLPKLSSLTKNEDIRSEIYGGIKTIMPFFIVLAIGIFIAKEWIVIILYSREFLGMSPLFMPQLIGDFFMIFSFLISYMLLAKAMVTLFITSQVVFAALRILISVLLFNQLGIIGVIWANAIIYLIYSVFVLFVFRKLLFTRQKLNH